jgi:hypothetical protein
LLSGQRGITRWPFVFVPAIVSPRFRLKITPATSACRNGQLFIRESVSSSSGDRRKIGASRNEILIQRHHTEDHGHESTHGHTQCRIVFGPRGGPGLCAIRRRRHPLPRQGKSSSARITSRSASPTREKRPAHSRRNEKSGIKGSRAESRRAEHAGAG